MAIFPEKPPVRPFTFGPPLLVLKKILSILVEWFVWAGCRSCQPTISVKAQEGTKSALTWPYSSSSTTGLLMKGAILHLEHFSNTSSRSQKH